MRARAVARVRAGLRVLYLLWRYLQWLHSTRAQVSEEEMERRLLKRGVSSGRSDDNAKSIIKRFRTFVSESMPVMDELERRGVVHKVSAEAGPDEVYSRVCETIGRHPRPALAKE